MGRFLTPLVIKEFEGAPFCWQIDEPLIYELGAPGSGRLINVHPGFVTDGASVPWLLWAILPTWGKYGRAAVVHDFLCYLQHQGRPHPEAITRRQADAIFLDAMTATGVRFCVRRTLWLGARWGGVLNEITDRSTINEKFNK
jgi:hypothetical protein